MEVIVPRWMRERFKAGDLAQMMRMSEQELKNAYGNEWEKQSVVLRIEEVGRAYVVGEAAARENNPES